MLLLFCKFALNSTHSASTKQLAAFVVFVYEPNLPLEVSVYNMTGSRV